MSLKGDTAKWWRKKKRGKTRRSSIKLEAAWMKELVGDARIIQDKPKAWRQAPRIGMDKIRATTNIGKYFVEFASTSSIHGINHLTAPHRHPAEKFLAVLFILGALVTSILLSYHFWERYQNQATILVIDHRYKLKTFTVTTPSILACPLEKIDETLFPEVFRKHKIEDTPEARSFFSFIANATYREMQDTPIFTAVPPEKWLTILWEMKSKIGLTLLPYEMDNDNYKQWVITEEGFCMMLFSYTSHYMSYNYWMQNNWTIVKPPAQLPALTFFTREDIRGVTSERHAIKGSVYYPMEVPELENNGITMLSGEIVDLTFTTTETTTSNDVKSLSVAQRKCKIPAEGGLRLWPIYTHNMCILECKYELIRKLCGCYPHFARPMPGVAICTAQQLRCIGEKRKKFLKITRAHEEECGCYDDCDTAVFEPTGITITYTKTGSPNFTIVKSKLDFPHDKIRRELLFGFNDFLAAVGGAGGLFLGASVLSFAEILYFVTIHLFWFRIQLRREKKEELERQQRVKTFFRKTADKELQWKY